MGVVYMACCRGYKHGQVLLRDQFAMSALQGLLVNNWRSEMSDELFAQRAYRLADAMLEARK